MAFRERFLIGLLWRVGLLLATAFTFVTLVGLPQYPAASLASALLCLATILSLWRYVRQTNVELARFIDSIRFSDFSQRFSDRTVGSGFADIGEVLERSLKSIREERSKLIDATRFYEAVLDDAPIALLTIDEESRVELANKAARRLFTRHSGTGIEDFAAYGSAFTQGLVRSGTNAPRLVPLMIDGVPQMAMMSSAAVQRLGGLVHAVAVQPIQSELNAIELAAQSDLVRVLTHEIMNSMTPVTSLAHSAAELIAAADRNDSAQLSDARMAVETLARRADGVMHFVESYRQISRKPQVRRRRFAVLAWAGELQALFRASAAKDVDFHLSVEPPSLTIDADPDQLSQVLINLIRNGAEAAAEGTKRPSVWLSFGITPSGSTQIEIADNGPGVPAEVARDIFLPFFTTKADGTGVGLSVARQLVIAHGGTIGVENRPEGGALFRILI